MSDVSQSVTLELEALSSSGKRRGSSERLESLSPAPLCLCGPAPSGSTLTDLSFPTVTESGLDALHLASQVLEFISINLTSQSPKFPMSS